MKYACQAICFLLIKRQWNILLCRSAAENTHTIIKLPNDFFFPPTGCPSIQNKNVGSNGGNSCVVVMQNSTFGGLHKLCTAAFKCQKFDFEFNKCHRVGVCFIILLQWWLKFRLENSVCVPVIGRKILVTKMELYSWFQLFLQTTKYF